MLIGKIKSIINSLELNLTGKIVLTEAASGPYIVTPIIAAIAGAKVYAFTKDTSYGSVQEIITNTKKIIQEYKTEILDITFIEELTPEIIASADIITNSGHLRPLDKNKLKFAKEGVVIPLMYEAWEWREADLDINYVKSKNIKIGATNERHPFVDVFNYLGDMAIKQIFDAGLCPYNNNFILICNNDFGPFIAKTVSKVCSNLAIIDKDSNKDKYDLNRIDWIGGFPSISIPDKYKNSEAIIFTAYPFDQNWIGGNGIINVESIINQIQNPYILRFCGDIDEVDLLSKRLNFYPKHVKSGHMGVLPSEIGFDPIIRLQSGGLKVGELLLKKEEYFNSQRLVDIIDV
jgi:hypothetical protein